MEPGLSPRNPRVVTASRLQRAEERSRRGLTLLEGPRLLEEAIVAKADLREVFALSGDAMAADWGRAAPLTLVGEEALRRLSSTRTPQSPVAVMAIPPAELLPPRSLLVAWGISDPGNLGTIIRSAAAFGLDVGVAATSADPWSPKVLRAGMGGHFHTNVARVEAVGDLGVTLVAAVMKGGVAPDQLPAGRLAILIGSEAHGLPRDLVDQAATRISIPMLAPTESLNAAVAAGIIAYEAFHRT